MGNPGRVFLEGSPQIAVSAPVQTLVTTSAGKVMNAEPKRKGLIVVNTGTPTIKHTFGDVMPTQTAYHVPLKGCAVADDGSGSAYFDASWVGVVNAISDGSGTCVITEFLTGSPDWDRAGDWGVT